MRQSIGTGFILPYGNIGTSRDQKGIEKKEARLPFQ
jgi:hypothetical protein